MLSGIKKNLYLKIFGVFALFLCMSFVAITDANAKSNNKYAAFVMDAQTGLVLHQENANKRLHPASLTKMMTLLMVFDALERGDIRLNTRIKISKYATTMIPSKLGLKEGESIKIKDAIYALSIKSANDIAVAVAEKLGGSEKNFAHMMTKKARTLGMRHTRFKNASGLHDPRQISTARDMAKLGRVIVTDYRKYYHYFSKKSFKYKGKTYHSHNKLMDSYAGMDGLKTGYINKSGFNLVASAVRNDRRLIGVVFGGKTGKSRNARMAQLLDNSFDKIGAMRIAKNSVPVPQRKPIVSAFKMAKLKSKPRILAAYKIKKGKIKEEQSRWAMLSPFNDDSMFNRMIGQGDYDINVRNRIETGLIAISAHMGEKIPPYIFASNANIKQLKPLGLSKKPMVKTGNWTVQVGAFTTRARSNKAIAQSMGKLPSDLRHNKATVAPYKTAQGWIFRARLHGYTKESAKDACKILNDCVAIAPNIKAY